MYALVFEPSYNQNESVDYLSRTSAKLYTVPVDTFIPSFGFFLEDNETGKLDFNPFGIIEFEWIM